MYLIPHFVLLVFFFFLEIILEQKSNRKCSLVEINKISDFLRTYFFYLLCMCVVLCIVCVCVCVWKESLSHVHNSTYCPPTPLCSSLISYLLISSDPIWYLCFVSFQSQL